MAENGFDAGDESGFELPSGMFRTGGNPEEFVLPAWRPSRNNVQRRPAKFTEIDGEAIYQGDIVLGTPEEVRRGELANGRAVGVPDPEFRWPGGVIPYVADASVRARVEAAIAHWQEKTPFRFRPHQVNDTDYVAFKPGPPLVCKSPVGRRGGEQTITLGSGCNVGATIHEIGHTVGLWHEQSREDRDEFVTIVWENIDPDDSYNFDQHVLDGDDLGTYDYGSIMHYRRDAFSINGEDTIVPTEPGQEIGQRHGLSAGDIAGLKMMYPGLAWPEGDEAGSPADEIAAPV